MSNPLLTVIVPVYKVESYLQRCVNSILQQSYSNLELILVDDGSPDNCPQLCDQLANQDARIKVIHKPNGGLSSARNAGLKIASADYITFVDSDDWLEQNAYQNSMNLLLSNNADLVYFEYQKAYQEKPISQPKEKVNVYSNKDALKLFLKQAVMNHNNFPAWNKIYKKELFNNLQFSEGQLYEDMHFSCQIFSKAKKVVSTNQIYYNYFQNGTSIVRSSMTPKKMDMITESTKIFEMFKETEFKKLAKAIYVKGYFLMLVNICKDPNYPKDFYTKEMQKNWVKLLRKNLFLMMNSTLNLKQKIIYKLMCINYFGLQKILAKFY